CTSSRTFTVHLAGLLMYIRHRPQQTASPDFLRSRTLSPNIRSLPPCRCVSLRWPWSRVRRSHGPRWPRAAERRGQRTPMAPADKDRNEALPADDRDSERVDETADGENVGLKRGLTARHIRFMALGSAIGTGLFMGSSESIQAAGPAALLVYIIGGGAVVMTIRACGDHVAP